MNSIAKRSLILVVSLSLGAAIVYSLIPQTTASAKRVAATPGSPVALASPGRIEGLSDSISVGAAIDGVIQSIQVKEGDRVAKGQVLAAIGCTDLESALHVAESEAESLKQQRIRLMHGSRNEERQASAQKVLSAKAVREQAAAQLDRVAKLKEALAVSQASYEESRRDFEVADASYKAALRNEELVNADPLSEEVQRADADVRAAEDRIKVAEEKLGKCVVRAPMDGTILRVHLRQGESFSTFAPRPLFSLADISGRRVRAEVDERDLAKLRVGQTVRISASASDRQYVGKVTSLASVMGRKSIHTGEPLEKQDRDVLEAVAQLDDNATDLPVGLRVTVQFVP